MASTNKEVGQEKNVSDAKELDEARREAEAARKEAEEAKAELARMKAEKEEKTSLTEMKEDTRTEELVPVFLIKTKEKKDDFFCAINGRTYQIKRGETVMVPKSVQEVIKHQNKMDEIALKNLEKASKNFAKE